MDILWWLAAPLGVTVLAMVVTGAVGRVRRRRSNRPREIDADAFAAALQRQPRRARTVTVQVPERPSGVAVRPSQRALRDGPTRR